MCVCVYLRNPLGFLVDFCFFFGLKMVLVHFILISFGGNFLYTFQETYQNVAPYIPIQPIYNQILKVIPIMKVFNIASSLCMQLSNPYKTSISMSFWPCIFSSLPLALLKNYKIIVFYLQPGFSTQPLTDPSWYSNSFAAFTF